MCIHEKISKVISEYGYDEFFNRSVENSLKCSRLFSYEFNQIFKVIVIFLLRRNYSK